MTEPAFEAIFGQMSAHSFPTGPVIAEPFISPFGFTMTPALSFIIRVELTLTFAVDEEAVSPPPGSALSDDDRLKNCAVARDREGYLSS